MTGNHATRVRRARLIGIIGLSLAAARPASAENGRCQPAMPEIRSDRGLVFRADAYARLAWREPSSGGRMLDYARDIWRGRVGGRRAFLTFDEIPGTSGPNHAMDYQLPPARTRARFVTAGTRYDLGAAFIIRSGPLAGSWTVTNC